MACRLCKERGQTWSGDAPKCSFENGSFSNTGWNCGTANRLRDIMELGADTLNHGCWRTRCDDESCGVLWFEGGYIVGTWYKERGRTGMLVVMYDEEPPRVLTLDEAEMAIAQWNAELESLRKQKA